LHKEEFLGIRFIVSYGSISLHSYIIDDP